MAVQAGGGSWLGVAALPALCVAALAATTSAAVHEPPDREGTRLRGREVTVIEVPAGVPVEDYANSTYRLRVLPRAESSGGSVVEVVVDLDDGRPSPESAGAFSPTGARMPGSGAADRSIHELAEALTAGTSSAEERSAAAVSWIRRNIRYHLDRDTPQDPVSVLARRSAYCTGMAALTVELLEALGVPAREVAGYSLESPGEGPAGYHRWVELHLPGVGWSFVDPQRSFGFVPSTFVRLADERVPTDGGAGHWRLRAQAGGLSPVTSDPRFPAGFSSVWSGLRSSGGMVRVHLPSLGRQPGAVGEWTVVLSGGWIQRRSSTGGEVVFVDLAPGEYELSVEPPAGGSRDPVPVVVTHGRTVDVHVPR